MPSIQKAIDKLIANDVKVKGLSNPMIIDLAKRYRGQPKRLAKTGN